MNKLMSVLMIAMVIFALGVVFTASVPVVSATEGECGGPGQDPCPPPLPPPCETGFQCGG